MSVRTLVQPVVIPVEVAEGILEDKCDIALLEDKCDLALLEDAYNGALKEGLAASTIAGNRASIPTKQNLRIILNMDIPS